MLCAFCASIWSFVITEIACGVSTSGVSVRVPPALRVAMADGARTVTSSASWATVRVTSSSLWRSADTTTMSLKGAKPTLSMRSRNLPAGSGSENAPSLLDCVCCRNGGHSTITAARGIRAPCASATTPEKTRVSPPGDTEQAPVAAVFWSALASVGASRR
jgi:hypothetical protein